MIINHANYLTAYPDEVPGEKLVGYSDTVPGQGITPKQVVQRFINKEALPNLDGLYTNNHLLPANFERMDRVEKIELAHQMSALIATRREKMQARKQRPTPAPSEQNTTPPSGDGGKQTP